MVASYHEGTLVRTYIRVPGSGTDLRAKPALCDLSRVSTVVPPLPHQTGIGFITTNSTVNLKKYVPLSTPCSCINMQITKRPREEGDGSSHMHKNKKVCVQPLESSTDVGSNNFINQQVRKANDLKTSNSRASVPKLPQDHCLGEIEKKSGKPHPSNKTNQHQNQELLLKMRAAGLYQMLIKNHQIKKENAVLLKQIALFKQLIKDKKKVISALDKLNNQNHHE